MTGSSPTEVSTHVDGSLAGQTSVPDQISSPESTAPQPVAAVAAGMPLADLSGLPFMLVSPPTSYAMGPRGKLRSLTGELSAADGGGDMSNMSYQAGNGSGGTSSLGTVGSAPQTIPEPFTVLLVAPAMALAIRRRLQHRG